jgi:hypothetical protein
MIRFNGCILSSNCSFIFRKSVNTSGGRFSIVWYTDVFNVTVSRFIIWDILFLKAVNFSASSTSTHSSKRISTAFPSSTVYSKNVSDSAMLAVYLVGEDTL